MLKTLKMFAVMLTAVLTIGAAQAQDQNTCESDVSAEYSHPDPLYLEFDVAPEDAAPLPEDATCGSELEALQGEVDRAHDLIDPPLLKSEYRFPKMTELRGAALPRATTGDGLRPGGVASRVTSPLRPTCRLALRE